MLKRKTAVLVTEDDLLMDLAQHNVPASLLIEFSEKIVQPYYRGNLTSAICDLFQKTLAEQEVVQNHIIDSLNVSKSKLTKLLCIRAIQN